MTNILLLSDSHSFLDARILSYAAEADEIWHCGDFGVGVAEQLAELKPLKGVYGNIDDEHIRHAYPEILSFQCEDAKILMIHIGGYPGKYTKAAKAEIAREKPTVFISGHSHILKAMYDSQNALLHLNPGACGNTGWHKTRTMMRFKVNGSQIQDLEIIELGSRG